MHPIIADTVWDDEASGALSLFQDLLRFDTSNPPGDEADCATYVADQLRDVGIEPDVVQSAPGRSNVVARLAGDGTRGPLLLNAHLDVVPVEEDRWTHPPFAGEVHDGYLWGRGAVDMKNMAAMSVAAMRLLARSGAPLRRDVIFAGVADEEAGCARGSAWLVDQRPDLVRAEYALGEVGGFTLRVGDAVVYPIQTGEKGICWLRVTAHGATGHASMPRADNAVVRLAEFLAAVGRRSLPLHVSPPVARYVRALADTQPLPARAALLALLRPRLSPLVTRHLVREPGTARSLHAVLRNTVSPTRLEAGFKTNVIPGRATAELDGRVAVGSSSAELLAELRALADDHITFEVMKEHPPRSASPDTALFATISDVVGEHHPGAVAVPTVIPGFTDAAYWSRLGTTCYGFSPVRLEPDDPDFIELFHADDERIPVTGFAAGLKMLADVVLRVAT